VSVYFATCREANAVKIGSSEDPHGRMMEIQMGCPLEIKLEAVMRGGCEEEFAFHRRFAEDRIRGEWFTITPVIEAIISANAAPVPRPKVGRLKIGARRTTRRDRKRYAAAMAEMHDAQAALIRNELT
jgi:hypothetical protein